jgi:hypothetical protein
LAHAGTVSVPVNAQFAGGARLQVNACGRIPFLCLHPHVFDEHAGVGMRFGSDIKSIDAAAKP